MGQFELHRYRDHDGIIRPVIDSRWFILFTTEVPTEPSPIAQWLPAMLLSVGIVIMLVLWTMSIRNRSSRRSATYETPREQIDRIKAGHKSRENEHGLSAEFVTSATELTSRLENKAERLEQLIEQAEVRIIQLNKLVNRLAIEQTEDSGTAKASDQVTRQSSPIPTESPDPLLQKVCSLADKGHSPVEIAMQLDEQVGKVELILALRNQ